MIKTDNGQDNKPVRENSFWGIFIVLSLLLLINTIVNKTGEVRLEMTDYGSFVNYVDEGRVTEVNIKGENIYFRVQEEDGTTQTYYTGTIDDPGLVDRLSAATSPSESGKIEFSRIPQKQNSPLMSFFILWVLPGMIFYFIFRHVSLKLASKSKGASGGMGPFMSLGTSGAKIYGENDVNTTFADVAGQDEAKEALSEIVDFLHNPGKYARIGAKLPKGALLVGPPGTGKTLIARAVAGEAKVPFFAMSGSEFVQMFVGMGASKVRDLFKQANEKAPCIVFIDEIDAIGKRRDSSFGGNDEREQTLNQLLTEMDGFDGTKGVVILAATNRPESLDPALLRPGRFDRRIQMELPDLDGRKAILGVHLSKVKHGQVDVQIVARATAGSSGAQIANIVNEAALRAVRMGRSSVTTEDLEESVETVMAGAQKKGKGVNEQDRVTVAYHEIGHALVAALQGNSAPVHKITIVPRTSGALGYTMQVDDNDQVLLSKDELFAKIVTYTGGRAAEELMCGIVTTGASNDIEQATKIARAMITRYGMSDKYGMMALETVQNAYLGGDTSLSCSETTAFDIDSEVRELIGMAYSRAKELISGNRRIMDEAASLLLEKETITGEEFMAIVNK